MNFTRQIAVASYYYATLPWRTFHTRQICREGLAPLCVPFYHRVADSTPNSWTISRTDFARQIDWMRANVELLSLSEIQNRMRAGANHRIAASVTFDDGYAENCEFAMPYLVEHRVPCTYFVSLDFVMRNRPFPHDVRAGQPLRPNSIDQLRSIADAGIEIGAHTRTHCDMGQIDDSQTIHDEVVAATEELGDLIGRPIRYFAFPYGLPENLNAHAAEQLQDFGISGVCSAYGAYNVPGDDPFHIRRFHGDAEFSLFRNWMTCDPRKMRLGHSVDVNLPVVDRSLGGSEAMRGVNG